MVDLSMLERSSISVLLLLCESARSQNRKSERLTYIPYPALHRTITKMYCGVSCCVSNLLVEDQDHYDRHKLLQQGPDNNSPLRNVLQGRRTSLPDSHPVSSSNRPLLVPAQKIHFVQPCDPSRRPFYKKRWSGVLRSASRDSMQGSMQHAARKECSPAPSETSSVNSTSKLKNRVKNAFKGRLKATSSAGNLSEIHPMTPTTPRHANSVKNQLDNPIERELQVACTYLLSLPKSGRLEMLGGTADAVFNAVLKALDAQEHKVHADTAASVNRCLKAVLCWVDNLLLNEYNLSSSKKTDSGEEQLAVGAKLCDELRKSVAKLWDSNPLADREPGCRISADSGNQSIMEDSVTSTASNSPPPKPPYPSVLKTTCGKYPPADRKNPPGRRFVTESKTDSGIFTGNESSGNETSPSDFNGNHVLFPPLLKKEKQETIKEHEDVVNKNRNHSGGRLFSEGSLDDLLSKLNLNSPLTQPDPTVSFDATDSHTVDSSHKEKVMSDEVHSQQVTTDNSGRQITTTRVRTSKQVVRQAVTTSTLSSSDTPEDLLRRLRELGPGQELKTSKIERLHVESGAARLFNDDFGRLSPYDNATLGGNLTKRPPPIPPRAMQMTPPIRPPKKGPSNSLAEAIKNMQLIDDDFMIKDTPLTQAPSLPQKFPVEEGSISSWSSQFRSAEHRQLNKRSRDGLEHVNSLQMASSKSQTSLNGKLLAQVDTYSQDEDGFWHRTKDLYPDAPPLPPRRKNVMNYVRILGPGSVEESSSEKDVPAASSSEGELSAPVPLQLTTNFKAVSLSSYVVLRDRWKEHEQRMSLPLLVPAFPSMHNLSDLIVWPENTFKLPRALSRRAPIKGKKAINFVERLALPSSEILTSLDASDWLILRQKTPDSAEEVRGGPADALIVHSTLPGTQVLLYQEAFLTTYRTFITPQELISKLIWRYDALMGLTSTQQPPSLAHTKTAKNTLSILVRVVDELCPSEMSSKLLEDVNAFQYRLIDQNQLSLSRVLRQRILDRVEYKAGFKTYQPLYSNPTPTHSKSLKEPNIHEQKAECLATQLTCMDSELFQKIELSELIWWAQEQCEEKSPNLSRFTEHFNRMSFWVRTRVLVPTDHKDREKVFLKFIKVMKCLRQMGNFNSYLAILSALDSGPVRRLDWSNNIVESMKEHSRVMDSSSSFKIYRQLLADTPPPCLPYLGLILQDLTFVHIGNPDSLPPDLCLGREDLINFVKRWQQYAILDSVRRFKSWPYNCKRDDDKCAIFGDFANFLSEDDTWELSESLKPRVRSAGVKRLYVPP